MEGAIIEGVAVKADNVKVGPAAVAQDPFQELGRFAVLPLGGMGRVAIQQEATDEYLGTGVGSLDGGIGSLEHLGIVAAAIVGRVLITPTA
jgi:hypothetical protein